MVSDSGLYVRHRTDLMRLKSHIVRPMRTDCSKLEPMSFAGDLNGPSTALPHFWEHTVGSSHATLGLRADWQAQMNIHGIADPAY